MGLTKKFALAAIGFAACHLWYTCPKPEEFDAFFRDWFEKKLWPKLKDQEKSQENSNKGITKWIKSAAKGARTIVVAVAIKSLFPYKPRFTIYHMFCIAEIKMNPDATTNAQKLTFIGINGNWYSLDEVFSDIHSKLND